MFNDNHRWLKIIFPLLLIFFLIYYLQAKEPSVYPGYKEAKTKHDEFIGKVIYFGGKIVETNNSYITVKSGNLLIKSFGFNDKNKLNHLITGQAIYQNDGSLKIIRSHTSNLRNYKILISILPILVIGYFFFKEYRFDFGKMIFEKIQNTKLKVQSKLNSK